MESPGIRTPLDPAAPTEPVVDKAGRVAESYVTCMGALRLMVGFCSSLTALGAVVGMPNGGGMPSFGWALVIVAVGTSPAISGVLLLLSIRDRRYHPAAMVLEAAAILLWAAVLCSVTSGVVFGPRSGSMVENAVAPLLPLVGLGLSVGTLVALRRLPSRTRHIPREQPPARWER